MQVNDRTKKFFLEGATEPVALEFAISTSNNLDDILRILADNGLNVTADERETDKILVKKEGIITPPLNPKDIIPVFNILQTALDEAKCIIRSSPHIVDLKAITPCLCLPDKLVLKQQQIRAKYQSELRAGETSFEEHLINEALSSGKMIILPWSHKANIPTEIYQGYNKNELVFSGSTVSDPYRTVTQMVSRNVRMASSDLIDAIRYSHSEDKTHCRYELYAGKQRYGFFHAYKVAPDQCYYGGVDIELNQQPLYRGCDEEETMINRFKNLCVAEYLVIRERRNSETYYKLFPIPQDDERWQDFKTLAIQPNQHSIFATRYNLLFAEKDNPQAVIPLRPEAYDENGYKEDFINKRIERIRSELQNSHKTIAELLKEVARLNKVGEEIIVSEIEFAEKRRQLRKLEEESRKKQETALSLSKEIDARYNPVGTLAPLAEEIQKATHFCYEVTPLFFEPKLSAWKKLDEEKQLLRQQKINGIEKCIQNHQKISAQTDLSILQPYERRNMLRKIRGYVFKNITVDDIENAVKLYSSAQSTTERQSLFEDIYTIRLGLIAKNKPLISQMSKQIKNNSEYNRYPELVELFKKNNIFVKHTDRAYKMVKSLDTH